MLAVVIPIAGVVFVLMTHRLHWGAASQIGLLISIFVSIYFSGLQTYYGFGLTVTRRLGAYYRVQLYASLGRLAGCAVLHFAGYLGAMTAAWINVVGRCGRRPGVQKAVWRSHGRAAASYPPGCAPNAPLRNAQHTWSDFLCYSGQLALFLIAILGHNKGVAQVSALARLGQV
jgi:hypothetical protein